MKYNKILCLVLALLVCIQAFSISVSAEYDLSFIDNGVSLTEDLENIVTSYSEYQKGNITLEQLVADTATSCAHLGIDTYQFGHSTAVNLYKYLGNALIDKGLDLRDYWRDFFRNKGNQSGNLGDPSFDLRGNGFCIIASPIPGTGNDMSLIYYYYGDYAVINNPELFAGNHFTYNSSSNVTMYNCICEAYKNGSYNSSYSFSNRKNSYSQSFYGYTLQFYGDIRYRDNSPADDVITPIDYIIPEWDTQDEDTLKDFLNYLVKQLKFEYPDLSTVEGLLSAILSELQSLDHDDDNSLLDSLITSVNELTEAVENLRFDFNDKVTNINTELNFDVHDLFGDLDVGDILSGNELFSGNSFTVEINDYVDFKFNEAKNLVRIKFEFIDNIKSASDYYIDQFLSLWDDPSDSFSNDSSVWDNIPDYSS